MKRKNSPCGMRTKAVGKALHVEMDPGIVPMLYELTGRLQKDLDAPVELEDVVLAFVKVQKAMYEEVLKQGKDVSMHFDDVYEAVKKHILPLVDSIRRRIEDDAAGQG